MAGVLVCGWLYFGNTVSFRTVDNNYHLNFISAKQHNNLNGEERFFDPPPLPKEIAERIRNKAVKRQASYCLQPPSVKNCDSSNTVFLIESFWAGIMVDTELARIVLEEKMGMCVKVLTMSVTDGLALMAAEGAVQSFAMLEFWSKSRQSQYKYV